MAHLFTVSPIAQSAINYSALQHIRDHEGAVGAYLFDTPSDANLGEVLFTWEGEELVAYVQMGTDSARIPFKSADIQAATYDMVAVGAVNAFMDTRGDARS